MRRSRRSPVVIDQRDKVFVPVVTVIQTGTEVSFPNSDSVSHHVYSFAQPNTFELPLYKGKRSPTVQFDHAGVVTLGCNIHDSMVGCDRRRRYAVFRQDRCRTAVVGSG